MKKLILFLFATFFSFFFPIVAHADDSFDTSFNVSYNVSETGNTHVTFKGTLINTTDKYFASSYAITTGFVNATNFTASDDDGAIAPQTSDVGGLKKISVDFNHHALGRGKSVHFIISFDSPDVTKRVGNVWELAIPGIANQSTFENFSVAVTVPPTFGSVTLSKPQAPQNLIFTKNMLKNGGIFLVFGGKQQFDFTLTYHIKNDNVFPVKTDIALPPDTSYQTMFLTNLNPRPETVIRDNDGNWLARYFLLPSQRQTIQLTGSAQLHLNPTPEVLSAGDRQTYLSRSKYWEVGDSNIQNLAHELKTPERIYQYIVDNLTYDFSRVSKNQNRLGAAAVLSDPHSAVCLEFTDLFVALSRAAGIPAREVDGYAYTQNTKERPLSLISDVLHAWPEYYDDTRHTWIMVDPTWGNTTRGIDYFHTFDFDHFAFVIKGKNSEYPVPAGGYKFNPDSRDVSVMPSVASDFPPTKVSVDLKTSGTLFAGFPLSGSLALTNLGPSFISSQPIRFESVSDLTISPERIDLKNIPPFGVQTMTVNIQSEPVLTKKSVPITIHIGEAVVTKQITIYPTFFQKQVIYAGIALLFAIITVSIIATKARRIYLSRRTR